MLKNVYCSFLQKIPLFELYLATEESWNLYNVSNFSNSFTLSLEWKKRFTHVLMLLKCKDQVAQRKIFVHKNNSQYQKKKSLNMQRSATEFSQIGSNTAESVNGYLVAFMHISDNWKVICCFHLFKDLIKTNFYKNIISKKYFMWKGTYKSQRQT